MPLKTFCWPALYLESPLQKWLRSHPIATEAVAPPHQRLNATRRPVKPKGSLSRTRFHASKLTPMRQRAWPVEMLRQVPLQSLEAKSRRRRQRKKQVLLLARVQARSKLMTVTMSQKQKQPKSNLLQSAEIGRRKPNLKLVILARSSSQSFCICRRPFA